MKKTFLAGSVLTLLLIVAGCKKDTAEDATAPSTATPTAAVSGAKAKNQAGSFSPNPNAPDPDKIIGSK